MKRIFLLFVLAACGGGSTGDDGGANDSGSDVTPSEGSPSDGLTPDSPPPGDASLGPGQPCDPQNNLCNAALLCCSEPDHKADGGPSTVYLCEPPDPQNQCPLLP